MPAARLPGSNRRPWNYWSVAESLNVVLSVVMDARQRSAQRQPAIVPQSAVRHTLTHSHTAAEDKHRHQIQSWSQQTAEHTTHCSLRVCHWGPTASSHAYSTSRFVSRGRRSGRPTDRPSARAVALPLVKTAAARTTARLWFSKRQAKERKWSYYTDTTN